MIEVKHIKKSYGDHSVLNDVSLTVEMGSIYGLIGHNGAGKTTLLSTMAGLIEADSGSFDFHGNRVSYLPDIPQYFDYLTAGEYISFLQSGKVASGKRSKDELLTGVGLTSSVKISAMSRGMRQRLGLAAALVSDPDILLLDEPASALDPSGRMELLSILRRLRDEGKAIMLSTHILADMENVCDVVAFLNAGIIQKTIKISDLKDVCSWIVSFSDMASLVQAPLGVKISKVDDRTVRILFNKEKLLDEQKQIWEMFLRSRNPVVAIHNEYQSLDAIFQEVCGSC